MQLLASLSIQNLYVLFLKILWISQISKPLPGMFVLIWMYFSWWVQIKSLNFRVLKFVKQFWHLERVKPKCITLTLQCILKYCILQIWQPSNVIMIMYIENDVYHVFLGRLALSTSSYAFTTSTSASTWGIKDNADGSLTVVNFLLIEEASSINDYMSLNIEPVILRVYLIMIKPRLQNMLWCLHPLNRTD